MQSATAFRREGEEETASMDPVIDLAAATLSSSSDDDLGGLPRGLHGIIDEKLSSPSSSDRERTDAEPTTSCGGVDVPAILAKMPLGLRAQITAAAKSSTMPVSRGVLDEWSERVSLDVSTVEEIFASFAKSSRASAAAARDQVTRLAAQDEAAPEEDEYAPDDGDDVEDVDMDVGTDEDIPMFPSSAPADVPPLQEGVPFPGIPRDVSVGVVCGDLRGRLELKRGYKKLQERVRCGDRTITPSKFEADGGRASAKKWKISLRVVRPDGTPGATVGDWIDKHGYHPAGLVIGGEEDKPKVAPSAPPRAKKSAFQIQLDPLLDAEGDVALRTIPKFVRMMRETTKPKERALLLQIIRGTKNKTCLREFGQSAELKGLDVLQDWMMDAKRRYQSTLLVSILRTLKMIPVTLEALTRTSIGTQLSKMKSYEVPEHEEEYDNTEMNTKVVVLSKSVKNTWKAQITAPHVSQPSAAKPVAAAPPAAKPVAKPAATPVAKAVELGDDDLFGRAKKAAPAPKTTVVKTVTKITMEKKVAPPSVSTKKPSMSVNDLINKSSKATKFAAVPVQKPKETEEKLDKSGKKRKRKTVTWAPEDKLEQVRVFEKDAKQPKEVAFPDPSRDGATDASSRKALERRDREVEAERKAAAKQHQRRLDEMRATISWRTPRRIEPVRDHNDPEALAPGAESEEFQRILRIEAEKPSVKYKSLKDIPDSPAEAPNEDDQLDLDNTPAFFMEFQEEEVSPQPLMPAAQPAGLPANIDFAALGALLANVQQQNAGLQPPPPARGYAPPPAAYAPPPPPPQQTLAPQAPYVPGTVQPPQQPSKPALVGGQPVPAQHALNVGGKTYRGVCAFFNTPRGCNWGDKCGYLHEIGRNPT